MKTYKFRPSFEMNFASISSDMARFQSYVAKAQKQWCIDFKEVTYCDSAGLAFLIEAKRLSGELGVPLVLEGVSNNILALIQFYGLEILI